MRPSVRNTAIGSTLFVAILVLWPCRPLAAQDAEQALSLDLYREQRWSELWERRLDTLRRFPDSIWSPFLIDSLDDLRDEAVDRGAEVTVFETAMRDPRVDGFMSADYRDHLIGLRLRRGELDKAAALAAEDGGLRDWHAAGPFGHGTPELHDRVFQPEIDPGGIGKSGGADVKWSRVQLDSVFAAIAPWRVLETQLGGCAYALTGFRVPVEGDYALVVAGPDAFKVWVNGGLVVDRDRNRQRSSGRQSVAVHLTTGWNRILVKLSGPPGRSGIHETFTCRLLQVDGRPVAGLTFASSPEAARPPAPFTAAKAARPVLPEERAGLAVAEAGKAASPAERLVVAIQLDRQGFSPEAFALIEDLEGAADPTIRCLVAGMLEDHEFWPEAQRKDRARRIYDGILAEDPAHPLVVEVLARLDHAADKSEDALERLADLEAARGKSPHTETTRGAIAEDRGWNADAWLSLMERLRLAPDHAPSLVRLRDRHLAFGNIQAALEVNDRVAAITGFEYEHLVWAFDLALNRGDLVSAGQSGERLEKMEASAETRRQRRTAVLRARWRAGERAVFDALLAELAAAAQEAPLEVRPALVVADLLEEAGSFELAKTWLSTALERVVHQPDNRRAVGRDADHDALFAEYDPVIEPLLDEVDALMQDEYAGMSSVYVLDHQVTIVEPDGFVNREVHQVVRINDKNGVERWGRLPVSGTVQTVRVIHPDGKSYEPIGRSPYTLPALQPGCVFEFRSRDTTSIQFAAFPDLGSFSFQDRDLQAGAPYHLTQWIVILPKKSPFEPSLEHFDGEHVRSESGDRVIHVLRKRRVPRIVAEPMMPDPEESVPRVRFRTDMNGWPDVNDVLLAGIMGIVEPTPSLRRTAESVTAGMADDTAKVGAIHAWVMQEIADEEGESLPDRVLIAKSGDRTLLIAALLECVGVPWRWAAVMETADPTRPIVWSEIDADDFSRPLLLAEPRDGRPTWIDGRRRRLALGEIPNDLMGSWVYLTGRDGGRLDRLPDRGHDPVQINRLRVTLDGESATAAGEFVVFGAFGAQLKEVFERVSAEQGRAIVEQIVANQYRSLSPKLRSFKILGVGDSAGPLMICTDLELAKVTAGRPGEQTLRGFFPAALLSRALVAGRPERRHPLVLPAIPRSRDIVEIDLGASWLSSTLPREVLVAGQAGTYQLSRRRVGDLWVIERALDLAPCRIEPRQYAEFVKFCRLVDDAEEERIRLDETVGPRER